MSSDLLVNSALGGGVGALIGSLTPSKSNFADSSNSSLSATAIVVIVIILIVFIILLCTAVYKLTHSWIQTILCLFFGAFYLMIATLYYGFAGYKYQK
jgi:hypothetical protein